MRVYLILEEEGLDELWELGDGRDRCEQPAVADGALQEVIGANVHAHVRIHAWVVSMHMHGS